MLAVPSATFRHLNPEFEKSPDGTAELTGFATDELAGWNIESLTFDCTRTLDLLDGNDSAPDNINPVRLWEKSQDFDPSDPYAELVEGDLVGQHERISKLSSTCALVISVSRLSSTLVVQSIMPVAFVGGLAFVVFFSAPEALDLRISTELSLFLALTAVQFIFAAMLPLTSYLTAFDVFILLTYCTIVAIVIENLVVYYIVTREENQERRSRPLSMRAEASLSTRELSLYRGGAEVGTSGPIGLSNGSKSRDLEMGAASERKPLADVPEESGGEEGPAPGEGTKVANGQEAVGGAGKGSGSRDTFSDRKKSASSARSLGIKPIAEKIKATDKRFAFDSAYAYRVTCRVDVAAGIALLFLYILLSILNFTVVFT